MSGAFVLMSAYVVLGLTCGIVEAIRLIKAGRTS